MALKFAVLVFSLFNLLGYIAVFEREKKIGLYNQSDRYQAISAAKSLIYSPIAIFVASCALSIQKIRPLPDSAEKIIIPAILVLVSIANFCLSASRAISYLRDWNKNISRIDDGNTKIYWAVLICILPVVFVI